MGVRRVLFKDWNWETDGVTPQRWVENYGTWTVQSNRIDFNNVTGTGRCAAPAEHSTLCGTINQAGHMIWDLTMKPVTWGGSGQMEFVMLASAAVGNYLDDSYVLAITATDAFLYRSDNDSLTQLDTESAAHSEGTEYTYVIDYDPSTGEWSVTEDDVEILTATDNTYTTGSYIGCNGYNVNGRWGLFRVRAPFMDTVTRLNVKHALSKGPTVLKVHYLPDADESAQNFAVGDGIEVWVNDGTNDICDFWGKVETIEKEFETATVLTAYDWSVELLKGEGVIAGVAKKASEAIKDMINAVGRVLTDANVAESAEAAVNRTINGEKAYQACKKLCLEGDFYMRYDGDGKFTVSSSFNASGKTIAESQITKFREVRDLVDEINTTKVYHSGGNIAGGGSGSAYEAYGRSENIHIDTSCPDAAQATARSTALTSDYSGLVPYIDVWIGDQALFGLNPGDTGTITLGWLGLSADNFLVLEKEYDSGGGYPGMRLRLNITASAKERHGSNLTDALVRTLETALWGLGQQV